MVRVSPAEHVFDARDGVPPGITVDAPDAAPATARISATMTTYTPDEKWYPYVAEATSPDTYPWTSYQDTGPGPLSTHLDAKWTFRSAWTDARTPIPVLAVRFAPDLDDHIAAGAGKRFRLPVYVQRNGAPGQVNQPAVEVSHDDGRTWTPARVKPHRGQWLAEVDQPRRRGARLAAHVGVRPERERRGTHDHPRLLTRRCGSKSCQVPGGSFVRAVRQRDTTEGNTVTTMTEQSRMPDPAQFVPEVGAVAGAMAKAIANGSIPTTTIHLVQLRAGQIVGSTYHTVRQTGILRELGEPEERITAVASWRDAPYYTGAERVALELVEAVLTQNPSGERVPDALYARAAEHYDDKALWTLTMAIGQMCFFIPVALIAKPIPGRPVGQNYSR